MAKNLDENQLLSLMSKVFAPTPNDHDLTLLVDVPDGKVSDTANWLDRRRLALEWLHLLKKLRNELGLDHVNLVCYENVGNNNADLPPSLYRWRLDTPASDANHLIRQGEKTELNHVAGQADIVLALTEFSATAPLKNLAREHGFRAASMPGFNRKMLPALRIDYEEVHRRVMSVKTRLDRAVAINMQFDAAGELFDFFVDVRFRNGHASSGLIRVPGTAWNLPSGEAFIVPYEGERREKSLTRGMLPVQFGDEIVLYKIQNNRAIEVVSRGLVSAKEGKKLREEPAYGNIAEIGFGVLQPFGIKPIGEMLLDEKLGLHIAFGRSDHFGGATSPQDFQKSENVVHIDRIYIKEVQDKVKVKQVVCIYAEKEREEIIKNEKYLI